MRIKTLKDLSDNFETLSHLEEKKIIGGGWDLISTADGFLYNLDSFSIGHSTTSLNFLGGSFSYTVNDSSGNPIIIDVQSGTWGSDRFSLSYVDESYETNAGGNTVYYDNVTGYSFFANSRISLEEGGGYTYEEFPDALAFDAYGGYTTTHIRFQNFLLFDQLTGGYKDYSKFVTSPGEYYPVQLGGYTPQEVHYHNMFATQKTNDISSMLNNISGSKLAEAKKSWDDNPTNFGQPFDYTNYMRSLAGQPPLSGPGPVMTFTDNYGTSKWALKDMYSYFLNQLGLYGLEYMHSTFFENPNP